MVQKGCVKLLGLKKYIYESSVHSIFGSSCPNGETQTVKQAGRQLCA